jgi:SAM-dependent methyltransferase
MESAVSPDGCPVEVYRVLPPMGEPEYIHAAAPAGSAILELGCGAGRLTHALLVLGHSVVAVDQSPDMLAHVRGAETVLADIETLDLGRTFPVVVLASLLVNRADDQQRAAFLATCRRHVHPDGSVLVQRLHPDSPVWDQGTSGSVAGIRITARPVRREDGLVVLETEYIFEDRTWLQPWAARVLDDDSLRRQLADAGLRLARWLDPQATWLEAKPIAP